VTSVGENEEKANTIQSPLLVFFSPSKYNTETYPKLFQDFPNRATIFPKASSKLLNQNDAKIFAETSTSILSQFSTFLYLESKLMLMKI